MDEQINIGQMAVDEAIRLYQSLRERLKPLMGGAGRKPKRDYDSWDWGKKNKALAEEHGVNYSYVCSLRVRLGKAKVPGGKLYPACLGWDWMKSDTEIAREHGLVVGSVSNWRKKLGKDPIPRDEHVIYDGPLESSKRDWAGVNWGQSDAEVARGLGVTREYVRQKRAHFGIPKIYACELKYKAFVESFLDIKELSHPEARKVWPKLSTITFRRYCQKAGIKVVRGQHPQHVLHPWSKMDWRLPNLLLSKIWGVRNHVIATHRSNHPVIGKALFHFYQKTGAMPEEYRGLVEAQRGLAEGIPAAPEIPQATSHSEVPLETAVQSETVETQQGHNQSP